MRDYTKYQNYPQELPADISPLHRQLLSAIDATTEGVRGHYSLYVSFPQLAGPALLYEPRVMRSASMIKVFILGAAVEQLAAERLSLSQEIRLTEENRLNVADSAGSIERMLLGTRLSLERVLRLMITESDNSATNMLIDCLGMDGINDYCRRRGYTETVLKRRMMDFAAAAEGKENLTSARDLGLFFERLFIESEVGDRWAAFMKRLLLLQTDVSVLPRALPGAWIAHKTGELDGLYHDGGIIEGADGPAIVVLLSDGLPDEAANKVTLQELGLNMYLTLRLAKAGLLADEGGK